MPPKPHPPRPSSIDAAIKKLNEKVLYTKEGIPIAADGVPHHGPMAQHVEQHMKNAHDEHMEYLRTDPNAWPNPNDYKKAMKEGRKRGIESWKAIAPAPSDG